MKQWARCYTFFLILCTLATSLCAANGSPLEDRLKEHILFEAAGANRVGYFYIPLDKAIDQSTMIYIKTGLDYYRTLRPSFIILHLNTPGGEILASEQISTLLRDIDAQSDIPVVAYIDKWAVSAGALLAYSCRFIAISSDATMGAAQPVIEGANSQMEPAPEKIKSAMRAVFANQAAYYGRNPFIAEAMVDESVVLVKRNGQIIKLESMDQVRHGEDELISPDNKLLTLTAHQMVDFGVADLMVTPHHLAPLTTEEAATGKYPAAKAPLFATPFFEAIPGAYIDVYEMSWQTQFFAFLANPMIASLLFMAMFIGFYMEFNTPGFGVAGTVAFTSLFLIILSHFSLDAIAWLDLIMVSVGLLLLLLEIFVLPGFGVPGIAGILLLLGGLFAIILPSITWNDFTSLNVAGEAFLQQLAWLFASLLLSLVAILLLSRYVTIEGRFFRRFTLATTEDAAEGYRSGESLATRPPVGSKGTATGPLSPSGRVSIGDDVYDAVSPGMFIKQGDPIVVIGYEGGYMTVAPAPKTNVEA